MKFKRKITTMDTKDFIEYSSSGNIAKDRAWQRKVCWDRKRQSEFISSVIKGCHGNKFTVANLYEMKRSLNALKKTNPSMFMKSDIDAINDKVEEYNGKELTSVDGQNRENALREFVNNHLPIKGEFISSSGKTVNIENVYHNDLKNKYPQLYAEFYRAQFLVEEITAAKVEDIGFYFRSINSSAAINAQQMRNSYNTAISKEVRDLAETWENFLHPDNVAFLKEDKIAQSFDEELIAKLYMMHKVDESTREVSLSNARHTKPAQLDDFYELGVGSPINQCEDYAVEIKEHIHACFKVLDSGVDKKLKDYEFWSLFFVTSRVLSSFPNHSSPLGPILRPADFCSLVREVATALRNDTLAEHADRVSRWKVSGCLDKSPSASGLFHHAIADKDIAFSRQAAQKQLFERMFHNEENLDRLKSCLKPSLPVDSKLGLKAKS